MRQTGNLRWGLLILCAVAALLIAGCRPTPTYGKVTGSVTLQRADGSQERQPGARITFCNNRKYLEVTADQQGNYEATLLTGDYIYSVVDSHGGFGGEWGPAPDRVHVPSDGTATKDIVVGPDWLAAGNLGGLVCNVTLPSQEAIGCVSDVELTFFTRSGIVLTTTTDYYGAYRVQLDPGSYQGLATHPDLTDDVRPVISVDAEGPSSANWCMARLQGSPAPDSTW